MKEHEVIYKICTVKIQNNKAIKNKKNKLLYIVKYMSFLSHQG